MKSIYFYNYFNFICFRFKQNVQNSRVFTTKALATAINNSVDKPKVFVLITGVGAYEPSETKKYDESSPTTGIDFFSRLTIEWEKAARVDQPVRLVSLLVFLLFQLQFHEINMICKGCRSI